MYYFEVASLSLWEISSNCYLSEVDYHYLKAYIYILSCNHDYNI